MMESGHLTRRRLLELEQFQSNGTNKFQKFNSHTKVDSIESQEKLEDQGPHIVSKQNIPKIQTSFSRRKVNEVIHYFTKSYPSVHLPEKLLQEGQGKLMRLVSKSDQVRRFISILMSNAYILPTNLKDRILLDSSLQDFQHKQTQDFQDDLTSFSLLLPTSIYMQIWDFLSILVSLVAYCLNLFRFSFQNDQIFLQPYEIIICLFIALDSFIDSQRPLILQGELVLEISVIFTRYKWRQMPWDLLYLLSWVLSMTNVINSIAFNVLIMLLLTTVILRKLFCKYNSFVEQIYLSGRTMRQIYDIVTLTTSIVLFAHTLACLWHYAGIQTHETQRSWIDQFNLAESGVFARYNASFYWATMTMVTVGYGDITPQNHIEIMLACLLMLCSSCMYAYSMNSIGIIVKNIYDSNMKYKRSLIQINSYMKKNHINRSIQNRVRTHVKYQLEQQLKENKEDVEELLNLIPKTLKEELLLNTNMNAIKKFRLLFQHFSEQTIIKLAPFVVTQEFSPGDVIYNRNNPQNQCLYYLETGEVSLCEARSQKVLETVQTGGSFGEFQFFSGSLTKTDAISITFSKVYRIRRDDALLILKQFEKEWEKFHHIGQRMQLYQDFSQLKLKCRFCQKQNHSSIDCPTQTYQPSLEIVIKRSEFKPQANLRMKHDRIGHKMNSLFLCLDVTTTVIQYCNKFKQIDTMPDMLSPRPQQQLPIQMNQILNQEKSSDGMIKKPAKRSSLVYAVSIRQQKAQQTLLNLGLEQQQSLSLIGFQAVEDLKHFDQQKTYSEYMVNNNIQMVLASRRKMMQHLSSQKDQIRIWAQIQKYTFNLNAINLLLKIKKKLTAPNRKNIMANIRIRKPIK